MTMKPWALKWLNPLKLEAPESLASLRHGLRKVKVEFLDIEPGALKVKLVQGKQKPCFVKLVREPLPDEVWKKVLHTLSRESVWAAGLSAGEWPEGMERLFAAQGARVFPDSLREFKVQCSAHPDSSEFCKHAFWAWILFADRFEQDPLLLLDLGGKKGSEVLQALQQAQSQTPQPSTGFSASSEAADAPVWMPSPGEAGFKGAAAWSRQLKEESWFSKLPAAPFEWKERNLREVLQEFSGRIRQAAGERLDSILKDTQPPR